MKVVFLFSELGDSSPLRAALQGEALEVWSRTLRGTFLDCPITTPPDLVLVEPAPLKPLHALVPALSQHPVVGRVPWLLVLDPERVHLATELPCHDFVLRGALPTEIRARVQRLLSGQRERDLSLRSSTLTIDLRGRQARLGTAALHLTPQEFALLRHLVEHSGRAFSREALLAAVWGSDYTGGARTVDVHVRRLRAHLRDLASALQTVRNVGYRWSV